MTDKTLIFCTSYIHSPKVWGDRYDKWVKYYRSLPFCQDKDLFIIDDGSDKECLGLFDAENSQNKRYNENEDGINLELSLEPTHLPGTNLFHFEKRLGVNPIDNAPGLYGSTLGWYRSFFFSLQLAERFGYEKIIHLEADAYLVTQKICDYIDNLNSGWTSFYCPKYRFPETSIQVICKDNFDKLKRMSSVPLDSYKMSLAEDTIPFTHVERGLIGDRYGEFTTKQLPGVDYFNQCRGKTVIKFRQ